MLASVVHPRIVVSRMEVMVLDSGVKLYQDTDTATTVVVDCYKNIKTAERVSFAETQLLITFEGYSWWLYRLEIESWQIANKWHVGRVLIKQFNASLLEWIKVESWTAEEYSFMKGESFVSGARTLRMEVIRDLSQIAKEKLEKAKKPELSHILVFL